MKKLILLFITTLLFAVLPAAAETDWVLDDTTITFSGTGTLTSDWKEEYTEMYPDASYPYYVWIIEGITEIGDDAFQGLQTLREAYIPSTVTRIGDRAFAQNQFLTRLTIPDSVTEMGTYVVTGTILDTYAGSYAESWARANKTAYHTIDGPDMTIYDNILFSYVGTEKNVIVPSGVTEIARDAFFKNRSIETVSLPDTLEVIGLQAFWQTTLKSLSIPDSVHTIGSNAFWNNRIETLTLGKGLEVIEAFAFSYNKLNTVTLPDSLKSVGNWAFSNNNLTSVILPDNLEFLGKNPFGDATMVVTKGSKAEQAAIASGAKYTYKNSDNKIIILVDNEEAASVSMNYGETLPVSAYIPDGSTPNITWKSSAPKVVSVNEEKGTITAQSAGTAKITASYKDGKKRVSASVTVKVTVKVQDGAIEISGPESVAVGKTAKFTAKINQTPAPTNKTIVWISDDTSKATVTASGVVTGKAVTDSVKINACAKDSLKPDGNYTNCTSVPLKVTTAATEVKIIINGSQTLDAGETVTLQAEVIPAEASQSVEWTAKSSKVANISIDDGIVTVEANGKGTITIKATTTDGTKKSASIKLTVGVKPKNLSIKAATDTVAVKKTLKLTPVFTPVPTNKKVTWSIPEGAEYITLKNGTVTGKAPGQAVVQVCSDGNSEVCASMEVTVIAPVTSVKLNPAKPLTLDIGGGSVTKKITASVLPDNATKQDLEWTSSQESVATVDSDGNVTAVGVGSTVITAAAQDGSKKSAKLTVKVVSKVQPGSLSIIGNESQHTVNQKETTTLTVKFSQTNLPTNQKVKWTSSAPKVASVSANGVVKGLKAGETAIITATSLDNKDVYDTWEITVEALKSDALVLDDVQEADTGTEQDIIVEEPQAETEEESDQRAADNAQDNEPEAGAIEAEETAPAEESAEEVLAEETVGTEAVTDELSEELAAEAAEEPASEETVELTEEPAAEETVELTEESLAEETSEPAEENEPAAEEETIPDIHISDLTDEGLKGQADTTLTIERERFELSDEELRSLVFEIEDESIAVLAERNAAAGIELLLLNAGETKLQIRQQGSNEVLYEVRITVTLAPSTAEETEEVTEVEDPKEEIMQEETEEAPEESIFESVTETLVTEEPAEEILTEETPEEIEIEA